MGGPPDVIQMLSRRLSDTCRLADDDNVVFVGVPHHDWLLNLHAICTASTESLYVCNTDSNSNFVCCQKNRYSIHQICLYMVYSVTSVTFSGGGGGGVPTVLELFYKKVNNTRFKKPPPPPTFWTPYKSCKGLPTFRRNVSPPSSGKATIFKAIEISILFFFVQFFLIQSACLSLTKIHNYIKVYQ
jgi:hypothetical protein